VVVSNPQLQRGDETNRKYLGDILKLTLAGTGVGMGIRSILGFRDMLAKNVEKRRRSAHPAVIDVGVPRYTEEREKVAKIYWPPKTNVTIREKPTMLDRFLGRNTDKFWAKPWAPGAAVLLPAAGLYGGYKFIDYVMNKIHQKEREKELEGAKEDYRKALVQQYTTDSIKSAEDVELAKDLDELAGHIKRALSWSELIQGIAAGYIPLAAILAGGTGLAAYNWTKSQSPEERLANAIKQRERLRWAARPPEIYAVAKDIPVRLQKAQTKDTFAKATPEEEEEVRKIARWYMP
jgi:hypothetical protein